MDEQPELRTCACAPGPDRRAVLRGAAAVLALPAVLAGCGGAGDSGAGSARGAGGGAPGGGDEGDVVASLADVPVGGGIVTGAAVVVRPGAGDVRGFSPVCTHQGCQLSAVREGAIVCACHGSRFSVEDGSVLQGPAEEPLAPVPLRVQGEDVVLA